MKKYLLIYKQLLIANWYTLIEYRTDFFSRLISGLMFSLWHMITVLLLTYNVPSAFGWTRNELLLLAATYSVFIGLYHTFISRNMARLVDEIYFGRLDFLLLKPIDVQLSATIWIVDYMSLFRFVLGLGLTAYFINFMGLTVTLSMVLTYILAMLVGIFILYSIWLMVVSLTIFHPRLSNVVVLLFNLSNIARYPREMYVKLPIYLSVALLPLGLIMTTPTKVILQKFNFALALEIITLLLLLSVLARLVWMRSLRFYTSASS